MRTREAWDTYRKVEAKKGVRVRQGNGRPRKVLKLMGDIEASEGVEAKRAMRGPRKMRPTERWENER